MSNRKKTAEKVANGIVHVAVTCCVHGVNEVFTSSLICRKNSYLNKKITKNELFT